MIAGTISVSSLEINIIDTMYSCLYLARCFRTTYILVLLNDVCRCVWDFSLWAFFVEYEWERFVAHLSLCAALMVNCTFHRPLWIWMWFHLTWRGSIKFRAHVWIAETLSEQQLWYFRLGIRRLFIQSSSVCRASWIECSSVMLILHLLPGGSGTEGQPVTTQQGERSACSWFPYSSHLFCVSGFEAEPMDLKVYEEG